VLDALRQAIHEKLNLNPLTFVRHFLRRRAATTARGTALVIAVTDREVVTGTIIHELIVAIALA
jgi:hypothetical protein